MTNNTNVLIAIGLVALLAVLWYVAPGLIQLPGGFSATDLKGTPTPTPTFAPLTFSGTGDQATSVGTRRKSPRSLSQRHPLLLYPQPLII